MGHGHIGAKIRRPLWGPKAVRLLPEFLLEVPSLPSLALGSEPRTGPENVGVSPANVKI